jgi:serine-type D-Ala-D-Ala carboxypeptidase/endopeptidase (penicillin-binding protein 4)
MKSFPLIILVSLCFISSAQTTTSLLASFLKNSSVKNAVVSICVADATTDSILFSTTPQQCVVPASVQKLITSATALELLGGDYKFTTKVWANGAISNGKLTGDLVITGGGDPTLGSENFVKKEDKKKFLSEWAHRIKAAGIDTITGNIIADPTIFSDQDVPGSWLWEDIGNHFGAAASGIAIYDDIFELIFNVPEEEDKPAKLIKTVPEIPGLIIKNEVLSSPKKSDDAYVFGSPFDSYRLIKGTLPAGSSHFAVKASIPDPALLLASELKSILTDSLVFVGGDVGKQKMAIPSAIDTGKIIVEWVSPSLSEIVDQMNKESVNLYAETLLKQIGLTVSGKGTTEAGTAAIKDYWNKKGIDAQNLFLADGSGLSRANTFTAKTLVDILVYMKTKSKWFDTYQKSIPITGIEGTQKYYFQDSVLKGKAHAKTGSMTRVRSMAGYMTAKSGKEIAFAVIINNYNENSSVVKSQMEGLLEKIYFAK